MTKQYVYDAEKCEYVLTELTDVFPFMLTIENQPYDLPEVLASIFLSDNDDIESLTIDEFYDFMGIPENIIDKNDYNNNIYYRNDFATGSLVSQANILYRNATK